MQRCKLIGSHLLEEALNEALFPVIPAQAGTQRLDVHGLKTLDPSLRRDDEQNRNVPMADANRWGGISAMPTIEMPELVHSKCGCTPEKPVDKWPRRLNRKTRTTSWRSFAQGRGRFSTAGVDGYGKSLWTSALEA